MMQKGAMRVERSWTSIFILTVIVYFMSHGLMLLVYGAWWDDMLLWNVSLEDIDYFLGPDNFNNPFLFYIIKSIASIENIKVMTFLYRLVPFVCWLISVSSFFFFCKMITQNKWFTLYASLLAASCGLNKCMLLICCYHYSISIALFMVGLVLFVYDYYKENYFTKLCVAILWLLSLLVWRSAVLVVPVAMVMASMMKVGIDRHKIISSIMKILSYLIRNYYLILFCLVIFILLYLTILAPRGVYSSYYAIDLKSLLLAPLTTFISCLTLILNYVINVSLVNNILFFNGTAFLIIGIFLVFLLYFVIEKKYEEVEISASIKIVAVVFLFFSMMPHLLKEICFSFDISGYTSRITSLAVFPISMLLGYMFCRSQLRYKNLLFSIFLLFSSLYSIKTYADYNRGWDKNVEIAQFLKSKSFLNGCRLKFQDTAVDYSTFPTEAFRYYDMEGCARLAYGKNTKTICSNYYHKGERDSLFEYDYLIHIYQNDNYGLPHSIRSYLIGDDGCHMNNLNFELIKNVK